MKKSIRISISIFLSALILLSGSGLVIGKMVCLKSNHEIIYASAAKDCCGKENESAETSFKSKCCDIQNIAFHQANFVPTNHLTLNSSAAATATTTFLSTTITSLFSSISPTEISLYKDPPLLQTSSSSLPLLGIFRI